jgi:radical SAM superfamily enzyme YgiQ (UPF0313 family)
MKVTLIYPGIVGVGFNSIGKGGMDRNWINLGLAYIGACLKKSGHDVDLIDLRECASWNHVESEMRERNPDVFGVYVNTPNYNHAVQCCSIARQMGKIVVAGGPHATIHPDEMIKAGLADHVIKGEGEISFPELLDELQAKGKADRVIQGKTIENLDELPFPARELYPLEKISHPAGNFPFMDNGHILLTSRGCPFQCAFCQPLARKLFGKKIRQRSVENVLSELRHITRAYRVNYVSFQDDTLTARKDWVLELCRRIREEKLSLQWSAQSRADTFDEDLAKAMSEAGCVCLFFGFESGSQKILDLLRKGINPEQSIRAAELCKKYGILIFADYMIGVPTETEQDLLKTVAMVKKIRAEIPSLTYFTPIPGSDLYDYCRDRDLLNIHSYEDYTRNPYGEKIRGIDYSLLNQYRNLILGGRPKWYSEMHYAALAFKRWSFLLKRGMVSPVLKEVLSTSMNDQVMAAIRRYASR